ncbi:MAG: ComF family protein, partial [Pseudomonadota bacterium]
GNVLAEALAPGTVGTVVPMPMHRKRYIQRGFNHAEVLARDVARAHGLRMETTATRVRHTDPQVGLSARERRRNVRNAFAMNAAREPGQPLVLVDDIYTTGESLRALARAGHAAGYGAITVLCLARAELGRSAL